MGSLEPLERKREEQRGKMLPESLLPMTIGNNTSV